jgi:hypothetical protein
VKYKKRCFMYIFTCFFIIHYTQCCTSCTLSPLFYISLHTELHFMYIATSFLYFTTELYFRYIVTSFLCFTTHSCTSCMLSPLFYVSLHTEFSFMYIVTSFLCFTKHKKEVTMYMKNSSVCSET